MIDFHLASRSPRRADLLRLAGFRFDCVTADVPEAPGPGETPDRYALRLALDKARAGRARTGSDLPVLGADTDVVVDGTILGKPRDREDAVRMLLRLSDRTHEVVSAVAVVGRSREATALSRTDVVFGPVARADAEAYWDSGEPHDKAGAYAIQGGAARWIREIRGSHSGVIGLPLFETAALLARFGVAPHPASAR
ncbi:MAG TPA: Maf family protein [Nevskiaceae bacterium]|nr:Maf family protein [Nevskiaceae bacterium]